MSPQAGHAQFYQMTETIVARLASLGRANARATMVDNLLTFTSARFVVDRASLLAAAGDGGADGGGAFEGEVAVGFTGDPVAVLDRQWVWATLGRLARGVGRACNGTSSATALDGSDLATVWSAAELERRNCGAAMLGSRGLTGFGYDPEAR